MNISLSWLLPHRTVSNSFFVPCLLHDSENEEFINLFLAYGSTLTVNV